jgi:hypothetical protein
VAVKIAQMARKATVVETRTEAHDAGSDSHVVRVPRHLRNPVREGTEILRRSAHKAGRATAQQDQGSFTRNGEHFDLLRLASRGKVRTIPKVWPAFLLPF